jgi:glucosamine-6-phosphate deaminase
MKTIICKDKDDLGRQAAQRGVELIRRAIDNKGRANIVVGTGPSQFGVFDGLIAAEGVDFSRVVMFHLDEYVGIDESHAASFRGMLRRMLVERLTPRPEAFYVNGQHDLDAELRTLAELMHEYPLDVAFLGIGENGHLAFNDPPADFDTQEPFIVVDLADSCKRQQVGEGHFPSIDAVPPRAITMSIHRMMTAEHIVCAVPDKRKAEAVRGAIEGPITNECPASILQRHQDAVVYLEPDSASLLSGRS